MSDQHVDQIYRQKLSDGAVPVPADLWMKIEPHLPTPGKSHRRIIYWIIGLGILLAAGALIWKTLADLNAPEKVASTHIPLIRSADDAVSETVNANSAYLIPSTPTNETSVLITESILSQEKFSSTLRQPKPSHIVPTASITNTVVNLSGSVSASDIPSALSSSSLADDNAIQAIEEADVSRPLGVKADARFNSSLLSSGIFLLPSSAQRKLPDPAKDCYSFGSRRNKGNGLLFAEVYAGPGFSTRNLTSRAEDVSAYIAQRDSTESSKMTWNAGLRVGYLHRSGVSLRIGAHYTQAIELFDYVNGSWSQWITQLDTIFDGGGNIVSIDTVLVNQTGKRVKTTHNRYHTIDIPVLLGYQVQQGNWSYGIQAGPVFNITSIKKGDILSPAGDPVSISDDNDMEYPAFKDKLGLSIYASAHLAKRIGYRTWLYAEPYFQKRLSAITLDSYPIDQRQSHIGLSLGLRVTLY